MTIDPRSLDESMRAIVAAANEGRIPLTDISLLAEYEANAAFDLSPQPIDLLAHLQSNYSEARTYLERLSGMPPDRVARITSEEDYTYIFRPRTSLRRVLDHAIDHLEQIDQWLEWQQNGVAPTPSDGWASSAVTLEEDVFPISTADLNAWLWRIDQVMKILFKRVGSLTREQLDWVPPDGGWTLRTTLHHLARDRFYVFWLMDVLPEEPISRFQVAASRFRAQIANLVQNEPPDGHVFFDRLVNVRERDEIVAYIFELERQLIEEGQLDLVRFPFYSVP